MSDKTKKILFAIYRYFTMFMSVAFVISCCMMLFVTSLEQAMDLRLTENDISVAAKLTFVNVLILTVIFIVVDVVRRKVTVERHVKRITEATDRMMRGDFSARITGGFAGYEGFSEICECINKMAEELSGIETLRADFISNVSHELKTPLAIIRNYATMIDDQDLSDDERHRYARSISAAAKDLSDLVTNILRLSKLENQQIYPSASVYDLGEQLCECFLTFEKLWEEKGIRIEADIQENVFVNTDAELMMLVWNNLFSNAIKFTDRDGCVSVRLHTEGELAIVDVEDTGCGISSEVGMHIFDKFYQGDTSHKTQGNGLGLTLVKRVIDIVGSEISVSSELSRGSTFTVKMRREI